MGYFFFFSFQKKKNIYDNKNEMRDQEGSMRMSEREQLLQVRQIQLNKFNSRMIIYSTPLCVVPLEEVYHANFLQYVWHLL